MKNLNTAFDLLLFPFLFVGIYLRRLSALLTRCIGYHYHMTPFAFVFIPIKRFNLSQLPLFKSLLQAARKKGDRTDKYKHLKQNHLILKMLLLLFTATFFTYASNTPNLEISPLTKTISAVEGNILLSIFASPPPDRNSIQVSLENACTDPKTTISVTLSKNASEKQFTVDTSSLSAGDTCTIKILEAVGLGKGGNKQEVGSITNSTTTILVTDSNDTNGTTPPPSTEENGLSVYKTASYTRSDYNGTITYYISVTNESETLKMIDINITDFPQIADISDFHIIDSGGFNSCEYNQTLQNTLYCEGAELDPVTYKGGGKRRIVDFTTVIYSLKAPNYDTTLLNTVTVDGANDVGSNHKTDIAIVFVGEGSGGVIYIPIAKKIDIIDRYTSDAKYLDGEEQVLRTMIASKYNHTLTALNLDGEGVPKTYTSSSSQLPLLIMPYLSNATCTSQEIIYDADTSTNSLKVPFSIVIFGGNKSATGNMIVPQHVQKNSRFYITYMDLNEMFDISSDPCFKNMLNSDGTLNTGGNLKGLGQCGNSPNQHYKPAFGQAAYDRCLIGNGKPCTSSNHGKSCNSNPTDPACTDYNPIYDNDFGCLMCTLNIAPDCSSDNFAIRPKNFYVNITDGDIFVAEKPEALFFHAPDDNNITPSGPPPYDYNENQNTSFVVDLNVSDSDGCQIKNLTISPLINFIDGIHQDNFSFNDIGDINMSIHEVNGTEFALVDADDTNDSQRFIEDFNVNFRVIPDHFKIDANLINHNSASQFTYLHNFNRSASEAGGWSKSDYTGTMAAILDVNISARGHSLTGDGNITSNYIEGCYAKDTNLTLDINDTNITHTGSAASPALSQFIYYNDINESEGNYSLPAPVNGVITIKKLFIEKNAVNFLPNAPDGNGTAHPLYRIDFDRKMNRPVNPFILLMTDANITDDDNVTGIDSDDSNATFYYARTKPSKYLYVDETSPVNTPISVVIYNDPITSSFELNASNFKSTNEYEWYLSTKHLSDTDGNITLKASTGDTVNVNGIDYPGSAESAAVTITNGVNTPTVTVSCGIGADVDITFGDDTNNWMIYNPNINEDLPPDPFYRVQCIGISGWAGHGDTGHVVEDDPSIKKNRRLGW